MAEVLALIGARSGSTGLKDKNIRKVCGIPLLGHAVLNAKAAHSVHRIVVSTDSEIYAAIAREYGAETPFIRPCEYAGNIASAESFLQHAVQWLRDHQSYRPDIVVYLQCTDLFRKPEWIDICVAKLIADPSLESAFVAYPTHKNYWRKTPTGYERLTSAEYQPRQERQPLFREDTGLGCASRTHIVESGRRLGDKVWILENHDEASGIDIHDEEDLWLAETVMLRRRAAQVRL